MRPEQWRGERGPHGGLEAEPRGSKLDEAQAAHHDDEPGAHVLDRVKVRTEKSRESLLHRVLGFAVAAQQSIGDIQQEAMVRRPHLTDTRILIDHSPSPPVNRAGCINTTTA